MTIDERAKDVAHLITRRITDEGRLFATNFGEYSDAQIIIAAAMTAAVAEERARCLRIAQQCAPLAQELHSLISDPIRPEHP